jgi:DNA-directed RNA polymerase specialized sigma24 family protein
VLSLEEKREKGFIEDLIVPEEKDEEFDRLWVQNLVKVALEKLKEECLSKATPYFELLKMHVIDELSHDQIAERSGKTNKNVRDLLHIARQKLKRYIIEEIALYASSDQEFKDEVGYLSRLLR